MFWPKDYLNLTLSFLAYSSKYLPPKVCTSTFIVSASLGPNKCNDFSAFVVWILGSVICAPENQCCENITLIRAYSCHRAGASCLTNSSPTSWWARSNSWLISLSNWTCCTNVDNFITVWCNSVKMFHLRTRGRRGCWRKSYALYKIKRRRRTTTVGVRRITFVWKLSRLIWFSNVESNDDDETFRPRSCVDSSNGFPVNDVASTVRKRWSGVQFGSKLASAFERLAVDDDETYADRYALIAGWGKNSL